MNLSPSRHHDTKKSISDFILHPSSFILSFLFAFLHSPFAFGDGTIDLKLNPAATTTISASGSYRVVDDVTMNAGISAITLTANDVTIDLNGHTITGGGGASANGVSGSAQTNVAIFGGTIAGFSNRGVYLGNRARAREVEVRGCGGSGIFAGANSMVEKCRTTGNNMLGGSAGIQVGQDSFVRDCVASANNPSGALDTYGINLGGTGCDAERNVCQNNVSPGGNAYGIYAPNAGCRVADNLCSGNQSPSGTTSAYGIYAVNSALILHNVCEYNTSLGGYAYGIVAGGYCVLEKNSCSGNTASGNSPAYGISAGLGCVVRANNCAGNVNSNNGSGYGISTADGCTVEANSCSGNEGGPNASGFGDGINVGDGCVVVGNSCTGNQSWGTNGSGAGINGGSDCAIRNNICMLNKGKGSGFAAGVAVLNNCRVVDNHCVSNTATGGAISHGIRIIGSANFVAGNSCEVNGTGGLLFLVSTNTRSETNRLRETTGIDLVNGVAPASSGAGDLADVVY